MVLQYQNYQLLLPDNFATLILHATLYFIFSLLLNAEKNWRKHVVLAKKIKIFQEKFSSQESRYIKWIYLGLLAPRTTTFKEVAMLLLHSCTFSWVAKMPLSCLKKSQIYSVCSTLHEFQFNKKEDRIDNIQF